MAFVTILNFYNRTSFDCIVLRFVKYYTKFGCAKRSLIPQSQLQRPNITLRPNISSSSKGTFVPSSNHSNVLLSSPGYGKLDGEQTLLNILLTISEYCKSDPFEFTPKIYSIAAKNIVLMSLSFPASK